VTSFATVYIDTVKHSFDHPLVRADVAIADPSLADTCPPDITYSCAFDALAHAIESTWSVRSTADSRALAAKAMQSLLPVLRGVGGPVNGQTRRTLSEASVRAGLAIDITRTTAGHAFAYPLTCGFGVWHGVACALNLVWLLPYTAERLDGDCQDPRGTEFVRCRLAEIAAGLGASDLIDAGEVIACLLGAANFPSRLGSCGVRAADLPALTDAALGSNRADNHPVRLTVEDALQSLRARL
jgi:alcohol dehydrogenase class IV